MILQNKRLPSYPLLVKDPYFSFWMPFDDPTSGDVAFWHGEAKPIVGIVRVDGKEYRFLGLGEAPALDYVSTEVTAFGTKYNFKGEDFKFSVEYLSPLTLDDLDVLSIPVCYVDYSFDSETEHEVEVELHMEERACFDTCYREDRTDAVRINSYTLKNCSAIGMGLLRQMPLSNSMDEVGADWGYMYLSGDKVSHYERDSRRWISASYDLGRVVNKRGFFTVAFDDLVSIFYFGQYLNNYWQRNGKTIFDAIDYAYENHDVIRDKCNEFDARLIKDAADFGEDYLLVLYASLRQSIGAHKLVEDRDGNILFLSKECNSDGCIATVDVSYPSIPLYLLYNPALVKGMLEPIFKYARMSVWQEKFAPHDVGIYPYCIGQYYALKWNSENSDLAVHDWHRPEVLPYYYQMPSSHELFNFDRQMPVEESGNMLVMSWLYYAASGDIQTLRDNMDLLRTWAEYLVGFGLVPASQLCTDDFAGHLDKNANLAVKTVIGIYCYSEMARALGDTDIADKYLAIAKGYATEWKSIYTDGDHTLLACGQDSSYSMKYNMAVSALLGAGLFEDLIEAELRYYDTVACKYGVPLDNRNSYVKTDWMFWTASMGDDSETDKYAGYVMNFFRDTEQRVPFSDWIDSSEPKYYMFRNRTVQGGNFFPILKKQWSKINKIKR